MSLFWKLEREIGLQEALECFQKALDLGREGLEHDVMGCQDHWVHGDIVYCEKSKYHQTTLIIAALLNRTATVWLLSFLWICLATLIHSCISISLINGFGLSPCLYVTNFLASVQYIRDK